jgi:hypothetical protein
MTTYSTNDLRDTTEQTMVAAHRAGMAYWRHNRPVNATRDSLSSHARTCGWHGEDNAAWLAGYYAEMSRTLGLSVAQLLKRMDADSAQKP